jgi:hypothetical protein
MSRRKAQLIEELQSLARDLPETDLEIAIDQVKALSKRNR